MWFVIDTEGALIQDEAAATTDTTDTTYMTDTTEEAVTEEAVTEEAATETTAVEEASPKAVFVGETPLGVALTDADGFTLYGFTKDTDGHPTCNDACADAWPPLLVDGDTLPDGLDAQRCSASSSVTTVHQLKAGKWPLYRFAGDDEPGQTNGQGSGDVWFVVNPDGSLKKG